MVRDYCITQYPDAQYLNGNQVGYPELTEAKFVFPPQCFLEQPEADREMAVPDLLVQCDHFVNLHLMKAHWGVITGDGHSSMIFWWRRWMLHSRSKRCTWLPWLSPKIWNSMCRGRAR